MLSSCLMSKLHVYPELISTGRTRSSCVLDPTHSSSVHFLQEWPVCVMRWKDRSSENGKASHLEVVDEFRSFARPVWRPQLSTFCMGLTGITQVGCLTFRRECSFHHQSVPCSHRWIVHLRSQRSWNLSPCFWQKMV